MATAISPAGEDVMQLLDEVHRKHHARVLDARVAVLFKAVKPFSADGRFNFGQVKKFTPAAKIWHHPDHIYDFEITIPEDAWHVILTPHQREALIDLHLSRCSAEFVPQEVERNGKRKPDKDQWGRIKYTEEIKLNEETGEPIWKVLPLDLMVFAENARRYGLWHEDLKYFKDAVKDAQPVDGADFDAPEDAGDLFERAAAHGTLIPNADVVFHVNPDRDCQDGEGMDDA